MDYNKRILQIKDMYKDDILNRIINPDQYIKPIQLDLTISKSVKDIDIGEDIDYR